MRFAEYNQPNLVISCDSQRLLPFSPDERILVQKSPDKLRLLHLKDYNYFNVLGSKLGWLSKLF